MDYGKDSSNETDNVDCISKTNAVKLQSDEHYFLLKRNKEEEY